MCYINYEIKYSAVGKLHPNTKRSCNSRYLFDDDNPSALLFFRSDYIVLCMTFHTWANGFFRHFPCYKDRKIFLPYQICNITRVVVFY